jgi:hypothetical protein
MAKKTKGLYHVQIPLGNMPASRSKAHLANAAKKFKKALKKHGDVIISGFEGTGREEIYRVITTGF